jgi:hypothetical protein
MEERVNDSAVCRHNPFGNRFALSRCGNRTYTSERDPVTRFHAAHSWAKAQAASNRRAVARASKVRPVKSSSGAVPNNTGGKGIDGAIAAAMRDCK